MTKEEALYKVKGYLTDIIPAEDYSEVEEIIEALEQEPKTGHWIEKYHELFNRYYCDKCGVGSELRTNYCPDCGARMESEE